MRIQLIRNATLLVRFADKEFLIDPMLGGKGSQKPFQSCSRPNLANPLEDLPLPAEEIIKGTDAVIITHLHRDHFDRAAARMLPKDLPVFVQNEEDAEKVKKYGFRQLHILSASPDGSEFAGIRLIKTEARHSCGEMARLCGPACGIIFLHPEEKTLYVTGDTVWYGEVAATVGSYQPQVIAACCGKNTVDGYPPLIMGEEDMLCLHQAAPQAALVGIHMESLNHWGLSRQDLLAYARSHGFADRLFLPRNGQVCLF